MVDLPRGQFPHEGALEEDRGTLLLNGHVGGDAHTTANTALLLGHGSQRAGCLADVAQIATADIGQQQVRTCVCGGEKL